MAARIVYFNATFTESSALEALMYPIAPLLALTSFLTSSSLAAGSGMSALCGNYVLCVA